MQFSTIWQIIVVCCAPMANSLHVQRTRFEITSLKFTIFSFMKNLNPIKVVAFTKNDPDVAITCNPADWKPTLDFSKMTLHLRNKKETRSYDLKTDALCAYPISGRQESDVGKTAGRMLLTGLATGALSKGKGGGGALMDLALRGSEKRVIAGVCLVMHDSTAVTFESTVDEFTTIVDTLHKAVPNLGDESDHTKIIKTIDSLAADGERVLIELDESISSASERYLNAQKNAETGATFAERNNQRNLIQELNLNLRRKEGIRDAVKFRFAWLKRPPEKFNWKKLIPSPLTLLGMPLLLVIVLSVFNDNTSKNGAADTNSKNKKSSVQQDPNLENKQPAKVLANTDPDQLKNEILNAVPENSEAVFHCIAQAVSINPSVSSIADTDACQTLIAKNPIFDYPFTVEQIKKSASGKYIVFAEGHFFSRHVQAEVSAVTDEEKSKLENVANGELLRIKGRLTFDKDKKIFTVTPAYVIASQKEIYLNSVSTVSRNVPPAVNQPQVITTPNDILNATSSIPTKVTPAPITPSIYQVCNLDGNGEKFLALKEGASASSARVFKMAEGTALTVLDKNGDWYQVKMMNGSVGWAHSKWLCEATGQSTLLEKIPTVTASNPSKMPSFNCQNASTKVEKMICDSQELSELDVQLSVSYKKILAIDPDKELLKKYQNNWRKNIRDGCILESCVKSAYKNRIAELK
jgi:uncharacterized protein YecT (DUF1311 family)